MAWAGRASNLENLNNPQNPKPQTLSCVILEVVAQYPGQGAVQGMNLLKYIRDSLVINTVTSN